MAEIESNIRFNVDTSDAMASIKALQSQISAFQRQMASSSVANAESARKLRRGLLDDLNATGQWSASIKSIESSSDSFTRSLEKNKFSMGEYFRYAGSQTKTFGRLFTSEFDTIEKVARERVKTLQTQYISLGRDANGALKSIAVRPLRLDMNDLATQTAMNAQRQQIFNQLLKQGSTNLLNFGKNTQWAGRQLMVGFTVPLSIFGSMASKTFMQLEEQAIRFKRVYGELFTPPEEADEMLELLKELGKEFTKYGVAVEKTIGLAADAAAMGKTGAELIDQVTEANRLAVLGNVEQAQALETTISLTNAFGVATENLAKKIDFLNAVENQTVVSIEDLTVAIPKAGPVVQQLGGDVEDLAFFLTAMKEGGINASEGANALKSGLASLINPTGVAAEMLKTFGINVKEITAANRGDVKGLVVDFAQALDELNPSQRAQAIEQLFGKFQFSRLSTLFQNVIQEGTQAQRVLEITSATTEDLAQLSDRELKRVEESTTFRFKKAVEEFQLAIAPVGEQFLKLITPIIEFATGIIEKFNSLSDGAKSFITGLTVLFGMIGPVAIMTFGLLANGIANIIKGFTFIRELFMKTGKQSTVLGEQLDYMTTEQLNAAAVAASLEQVHQNLIQVFSTEAGAVQRLGDVYRQAFNEQQRFDTGRNLAQQAGLRLAKGITSVPGPRGAGDIVPAVLSPGEAVIPAKSAQQNKDLIAALVGGKFSGPKKSLFETFLQMISPKRGKQSKKDLKTFQLYEENTPFQLAGGTDNVPGPRGAGDIVPALLSPGEAVIPAKAAQKYAPIIQGMIAGNLPGFSQGVMLGMPRSGKSTQKNRDAAEEIYQMFLQSSYKDVPPTEYGHQLAKTSGHSFPIFGLGGVYMGPNGKKVFVKPVMDEKAAVAEMRATEIARRVHGLKAPEQRIVVMRDPMDPKRQRRFLALESALDATFVNNEPMALFNEEQYFRQLVASLLRVDKDLSASNVFGDVVADVGPAGVFSRASGLRDYAENLPSMEEQAMINLLGIKGGAKRAFAESTLGLMQSLNPQQYHQKMIAEIQRVLPLLEQTVASFNLTSPQEAKAYQDMISRLRQGLGVDWSKFHSIHSAVKPSKPKQTTVPGYKDGVVSVPGPKGAGDVMPAMLSPGEAVIPTKMADKYAPLINAMIAGDIPGYEDGRGRGRYTQSSLFGQDSEFSATASHFAMFARDEEFAATLEGLGEELSGVEVEVRDWSEKLEDGTRKLEKFVTTLDKLDTRDTGGNLKDMAVAGKTYRGTTILESKTRNAAYEQKIDSSGAKVAAGAPFTLEEVKEQAGRAAQALAYNANMNEDVAEELRRMVAAGAEATLKLESSSSAQERLSFMYDNAEEALRQSYQANTAIKDDATALAMAQDRMAQVRAELADLEASGIDEEQLLQEAKKKLAKAMLTSGAIGDQKLQIISGAPGTAGNVIPDTATGRLRRGSFSDDQSRQNAKGVAAMRSTAQVASAEMQRIMAETGADMVTAATSVISSSALQNIMPAIDQQSQNLKAVGRELMGGVITEVRSGLGINSPSAEFEDISNSVSAGVRQGTDDAARAGAQVGEAVVDGATNVVRTGSRRVTAPQTDLSVVPSGTQTEKTPNNTRRRATALGTKEARELEEARARELAAMQKTTQARVLENDGVSKSQERLDRMNSVLMQGTFALTSLAGVGVMAGGSIGEVSQKIFEMSGIFFALMQVTQMLTQAKILEIAASRAAAGSKAVNILERAANVAGKPLIGFGGMLARAGTFLVGFMTPLGLVIAGLTALAGVVALLVHINNEQQKKITGLGDAAFMTAEKMKKAGDLLGFDPKTADFFTASQAGGAEGRNAEERTQIQKLRDNQDFLDSYKDEINAIRDAATNELAQTALTAVANQLFAAGAPQEAVDAYVRAIAQEAGKTSLEFDFAKINFAEQGATQIVENAENAAKLYKDAFEKNVKVTVTDITPAKDLFQAITQGATRTQRQVDAGNVSQQDILAGKAAINVSNEARQAAELYAGTMASSFKALQDGFANGLLSAKDFNSGLDDITSNLSEFNELERNLILTPLFEKLGITETMDGISSLKDQMLILQAIAAGVDVKDIETLMLALKNPGQDPASLVAANNARMKLLKLLGMETTEREKTNKAAAEQAIIDEKIGAANTSILERTEGLREQTTAYAVLIEKGYDAETAFELAGDSSLAAGIAAAQAAGLATGKWTDLEDILKNIDAYQKALANAPKNTTSGAADKTPYEETIEALQKQRKELIDNGVAFAKLRKAGFDTADAMKIAEDPITAAALATTKVGTEKWNKLIKAIKTTQALLSKKEIQDLLRGGKIERADKQAQVVVSNALNRLGWTAEQINEVLSDQEFTNTLADDLKDGKINAEDLLNRLIQIKQMDKLDIELNFTTKEGAADEFQKRYDKVVGYLEAQKQTIEIDFQIATFADNVIIRDAEQQIALIQDKIDDNEAQLTGIEEKENTINEAYDERKKALDSISKANDAIARQQKSQLSLADALSQGDIAAAARAAQEMRAQSAQDSVTKQGELLDIAREQELANLRSADGRSRKQIEEEIEKLKKNIFDIEEKQLEPARQRIRDAEYEKQVKLDSLDQQILRWEKLAARVNEAKLKLTDKEMAAMEYQAKLIADLLDNWNNIEDKQAILTIIKKTINGDDETQNDTTTTTTTTPSTTTTTTTTPNSTQPTSTTSSSTGSKDPGPMPPYSPGEGKAWKLVNNKWTAVAAPGPGPKPPYSPGVGMKWEIVNKKWTAVPAIKAPTVVADRASGNTVAPSNPGMSYPASGFIKPPVTLGPSSTIVPFKPGTTPDSRRSGIPGFAMGGMVKRYAAGGFAMGTDIIPSILTPGEFVVRRNAVQNFGVDRLKAINSGTYSGETVYNYEVNVNVQTNSDPNQIATVVVGKIKQIESQKIRSNRF